MELPKPPFQMEYPKLEPPQNSKKFRFFFLFLFISFLLGLCVGFFISTEIWKIFSNVSSKIPSQITENPESVQGDKESNQYSPQTSQEELIIKVVKEASPAVVSVIITKDIPKLKLYYEEPFKEFEEFFGIPFEFKIPQFKQEGLEKREIGGGTGFFISKDGMLLTNAHVVFDKEADYTVLTNDGKRYSAKVLARDTFRDLAILKVEGDNFPTLPLGDSDTLQIGQTVIAIGNALGEFKNTVSVGVISGLGRSITASGQGSIVALDDVIQTDAAINRGNSGGPLLNLKGEVIGVNFAMAGGAENIGFAIPINKVKKAIEQLNKEGKISYPFLGVRYIIVTEDIQKERNLPVNYGALILKGDDKEPAIVPGSPADKIGLKEGDIILEFNGEKITRENPLAKIIMKYYPGDKVNLKVLRNNKELYF